MGERALWEAVYTNCLGRSMKALKSDEAPRVVLGFHTTIDGMKALVPAEVEQALKSDPVLAQEVRKRLGEVPDEINTPSDLILAMLDSAAKGKALQRMIRSEQVFNWTMEHFGYDRLRVGGTSGNMANLLSPLGFPEVLVYVNPLTRDQADLLVPNDNLKVITDRTGKVERIQPRAAYDGEGVKALHWVFEYPKGLRIQAAGIDIETPRANRFIAAWNPVNNRLRLSPTFKAGLLEMASDFSHFIISGFHIVSELYPDGSTCIDCLIPVADFLKQLRTKARLRMHYEFASIGSAAVRKGIVEHILPHVDSLGLNEVEIVALLRDLGETAASESIERSENAQSLFDGTMALARILGLNRIHLHNLGYYICLSRPEYAKASKSLDGLAFAASAAASRTAAGVLRSSDDIIQGLDTPIFQSGLDAMAALASHLGNDIDRTGMAHVDGYDIAAIPTRVVANPVLTVGLGDLISASAFLMGT